ncbi:MAG: ATP-dependent helicase [Thermofilum sp. ex4484_79]|nr:MAG: ATP-dependent helicase [Thermofilum sp. ex4484_79]
MITYATKRYTKEEVIRVLNPFVAEWFDSKFEKLTPPQEYGIIPIFQDKNVLVSSPTGTGKTLTVFVTILSKLFDLAQRNQLEDYVYAVYVSPLRALNNDIYRNLEEPLREIHEMALEKGIKIPEVRHAVRTGDTPSHIKQKMLKLTPHILITTPETLAIILVAPKFRQKLKKVQWVIIDEIHSLAESKRGSHLSLSLERLQELSEESIRRIGLSATINPLEEIAKFLVGYNDDGTERDCVIVDTRYSKKKILRVQAPVEDLIHTPTDVVSKKMYEILLDIIEKHRTTLIFTNTRSGTERVVFHLKQIAREKKSSIKEDQIAAHHGSLSRNVRFEIEEKLKKGKLKAIVSSTSLELGIDIGYIDVVVQIGSPKSVTRCLQRIGRSGHRLHETSKGILVCIDRDDLVEDSVMVKEAYQHHLDKIHIPRKPLDVLAQHIMGMSIERKWDAREAFRLIKRSYTFHDLTYDEFKSVLRYLSGGYSSLESYRVYGKIWYDEEEEKFGRRGKYARVIYTLNIGTIPDEVDVKVFTTSGRYVGNIEEEFLERLTPGDRFVLGGKVYEFVHSRGMRAYVKPAFEQKPTIPSWFSEMLPLSFDLAIRIGMFRERIFKWIEKGEISRIKEYIKRECRADEKAANAIYNYFLEEYFYLKRLGVSSFPSHKVILVEKYKDEMGRIHHIFHTLYGRRTNDALAHALGHLASRKARSNIGLAVHDNGFALIYPVGIEPQVSIEDLKSDEIEDILKKSIINTELMKRRFRHVAARGLMILRNYKGHEISVNKQQLSASTLLRVVKTFKNFPILKETFREILEDYMDIEHAKEILKKIEEKKIKIVKLPPSHVPSPFSHNIVLEGLSDIVLMEDKRQLLEKFHRLIMEQIGGELQRIQSVA